MTKASQLLDLKLAKKRLDEYKWAGAPQPGMFSVMEEVIKQAPFEQAPGSEWQKYVRPGRQVVRGGVSFPLKQTEFDILGIEDIDKDLNLEMFLANNDVYTKADVLKLIREERPEFAISVGKQEFNPISGGFYTPPAPEVLPKQWLQAGAQGEITPKGTYADLERIEVRPTSHGQVDVAGGSKQSHRSPGSTYEESITKMPGIVNYPSGHYAPDVVVWSRASTHPTENYKIRLVEEIQSDIHRRANEKIYIDDTDYKIYERGELPSEFLDSAGEPNLEEIREVKRGYMDVWEEMDMEEWTSELETLRKKVDAHERREFLRGTDLEHITGDRVYTPQQYAEAADRQKYLRHLVERGEHRVSDAPFKSPQEYGSLELRKQLMNAVDDDADYLALIRGKDQLERAGEGFPPGRRQRGFELKYDKIYLRELEKLARRYKTTVEDVEFKVGIGPDVRPPIMEMDGFEEIDELADWINTGIEEGPDVESSMLNATQYQEFVSQMQEMMAKQDHIPADFAKHTIRRIHDNTNKVIEAIRTNWEGAAAGDQPGIFKWIEEVGEIQGEIHKDMNKLYERYLRQMGTAGQRTKTFPALKLTPEVKELIREIGVPLAKNEDPQEGEPKVLMAALGGLIRKYQHGGPVTPMREDLTPEQWETFRENVEAQRVTYEEEKAEKNAKLAARWAEGDVREDSGLIKYLKSITRSLAGAIPGIDPSTRQSISDTMRHYPSGLASQWQTLDPETGEASFTVPIMPLPPEVLHYGGMDREDFDEANAVIAAHNAKVRPNIIDETKMIPGLPGMFWPDTFGEPPQYAVEAMGRSEEVQKQILEELEIERPKGFIQGAVSGAGIMTGQIPVPGAALRSAAARMVGPKATALWLTAPKGVTGTLKAVTAPVRAGMEFFNPFIDPKMRNIMAGGIFGGALTKGAEMFGGEGEAEPSPETFEQEQIIRQNKARVADEWAGLETFENRMDVISDPQVGDVVWYWMSKEDKDAFVEEVHGRGLMTDEEYQDYQEREPEGFSKGGYIKDLVKLRKGIIDAKELFERQRRIARGEDVEPDPTREQIIHRDPEDIVQVPESTLDEIRRLSEEGRLELDDPYDPDNIRAESTEHLPPGPGFERWLNDLRARLDEIEIERAERVAQTSFKYEPGDTVMGSLFRHEIIFKDVDQQGRPTYRVRNLDEGGEYDLREEGIRGRFGDLEEIETGDIVSFLEELEAEASLDFEQFVGPNRGVTLFEEPIGEGLWEGFVELDDGTYRMIYDVNESDPRNRFDMIEDDE